MLRANRASQAPPPARRSAVTSRERNHTHVASTRQGGRIQVVKVENKGEGFRRLRIRVAG
jgi:hypothetical protein